MLDHHKKFAPLPVTYRHSESPSRNGLEKLIPAVRPSSLSPPVLQVGGKMMISGRKKKKNFVGSREGELRTDSVESGMRGGIL